MGGEGDGFAEETEDGAAGAGHGGVDGTETVETVLDGANLGMEGEDALLEVVDELVAPRLDGLHDDVAAALRGTMGTDEGEGLLGGDGDVGTDDADVVVAEVEGDGLQTLADALGIGWLREDEEGAVGTQTGSILLHLRGGEAELELLVEEPYHVGAVAGAAAHAGLCGYGLVETDADGRQRGEVVLQEVVGADDEVALGVALDGDAGDG